MSNAMDKFKLIAEIRKRPALWDRQCGEHKSKKNIQATWKDVAVAMGSDANDCSRTWQSLRCTNRDVAKKIELRIAKDKLNGTYDPKNEYKCQWVFHEHMKFINDIQKSSPIELNDKKSDDNDSSQVSKSHNLNNIKVESEVDLEPDVYLPDDGDDDDSQMHNIEFLSEPNSPQNLELADDKPSPTGGNCTKRSYDQANLLEDIEEKPGRGLNPEVYILDDDTVSQMYSEESHKMDNIKMEPELDIKPEVFLPEDDSDSEEFVSIQKSPQTQESADDKPSSTGGKYTKRSYDQAKLKDLGEKEHNLIKSARLDGKTSNDMIHVGDSDYKFLVSLLPQMKKLTEMQNIKFRVKMSDEMFNITSD